MSTLLACFSDSSGGEALLFYEGRLASERRVAPSSSVGVPLLKATASTPLLVASAALLWMNQAMMPAQLRGAGVVAGGFAEATDGDALTAMVPLQALQTSLPEHPVGHQLRAAVHGAAHFLVLAVLATMLLHEVTLHKTVAALITALPQLVATRMRIPVSALHAPVAALHWTAKLLRALLLSQEDAPTGCLTERTAGHQGCPHGGAEAAVDVSTSAEDAGRAGRLLTDGTETHGGGVASDSMKS